MTTPAVRHGQPPSAYRGLIAAIIALGMLALAPPVLATPVQWTIASGGTGHWYDFLDTAVSPGHQGWNWSDARTDAISRGGDLATPSTLPEWTFLTDNASSLGASGGPGDSILGWMGVFQTVAAGPDPDNWSWLDGTPFGFTAWASGEPNGGAIENHAVAFLASDAGLSFWNDISEAQRFGYYIEYENTPATIPEPSTALLVGLGLALAARKRPSRRVSARIAAGRRRAVGRPAVR